MWDPLFDQERCPVDFVPAVDFQFISECEIPPAPAPIFDCPDLELPPGPPAPPGPRCPEIRGGGSGSGGLGAGSIAFRYLPACAAPSLGVTVNGGLAVTQLEGCSFAVDLDVLLGLDFAIPIPTIPCPEIQVSATTIRPTGPSACQEEPEVVVQITRVAEQGSCDSMPACDYLLDFEFYLPPPPIPCPSVGASATVAIAAAEGGFCAEPSVDVQITAIATDDPCAEQCQLFFDFDFALPPPKALCPSITVDAAINASLGAGPERCQGEPTVAVTVTQNIEAPSCDPEACEFLFDFDFYLPLPAVPCPTVSATATARTSESGGSFPCLLEPQVNVAVTATDDGDPCNPACAFQFDFDFFLPPPPVPCPFFHVSATATAAASESSSQGLPPCEQEPRVDVTVGQYPTEDPCNPVCEPFFDYSFFIPPPKVPCPRLSATALATRASAGSSLDACEQQPQVNVTVTATESGDPCNPDCEFAFDFDFVLPPARVACPTFAVSAVAARTPVSENGTPACQREPEVLIAVTATDDGDPCDPACAFLFDFDFFLPPPQITCPRLNATATGAIGSSLGPCDEPQINVTITAVEQSSGGSDYDPCNPDCEFLFDFDFQLPPARVVLPSLYTSATTSVSYWMTNEKCFVYTPAEYGPNYDAECRREARVTANVTPLHEDPCQPAAFLLDFDFHLPVPVICPSISATAVVTVAEGPPDAAVTVTRTGSQGCALQLDFDFTLPSACKPRPHAGSMTVVPLPPDEAGYTSLTVRDLSSDGCDYALDFEFGIPTGARNYVGRVVGSWTPASSVSAGPDELPFRPARGLVAIYGYGGDNYGPPYPLPHPPPYDPGDPYREEAVYLWDPDAGQPGHEDELPRPGEYVQVMEDAEGQLWLVRGGGGGDIGQTSSMTVVTNIVSAGVNEACDIEIAYDAQPVVFKTAIVPWQDQLLGLHCVESPEVLFFDVVETEFSASSQELLLTLDDRFVEVCEPGSLRVLSVAADRLAVTGGRVHQGRHALLWCDRAARVTALVSGVRKGAAGVRFPRHSREDYDRNNQFWKLSRETAV